MTTNPLRSPDFRPDPKRGIFLSEVIDQPAVDRLTPVVLRLQAKGRDPITLFIDSPGGSVVSASLLRNLIRSADQDGNPSCRLITVATGKAASAASDLLMGGNYALAYEHARILCHGVRQSQEKALTREEAYELAKDLASSNERFAIQLADNCILRFIFRVATLSSEFPEIRLRLEKPLLPQTSCFIEAVGTRISKDLINVLEEALRRSVDSDALDVSVSQTLQQHNTIDMPRLQFEVLLLKAILDYEAQQHATNPEWSIRERGLELIQDKLDLLLDRYTDHHAEMTSLLCARWGEMFLSSEEELQISQLPEAERPQATEAAVRDILRSLWFFFVSICRLLQKDDYWMSAEDAYWLGLIDEVIGRTDLPCPRLFVEYPPSEDANASEQPEDRAQSESQPLP